MIERCVLGTAGLGGVWGPVEPGESVRALLDGLKAGIRAIDTSPSYGDAEHLVGIALQAWSGERPFVSTKVGRLRSWRPDNGRYDFSPQGMERSVIQSLRRLGTPSIDLLFLHDPEALTPLEAESAIEQLLKFKKLGYARQVGLGGNAPAWFQPFLRKEYFDVVMEYGRMTVLSRDAFDDTLPRLKEERILPYLASPLHMGLLGNQFEAFRAHPPVWLDLSLLSKALRLRQLRRGKGLTLHAIAHRFFYGLEGDFRLVIGPSDPGELETTLRDFEDGPLPEDLFKDILQLI